MDTWLYVQKHKNIMSSKSVHIRHHICRFICKYLVLKIHPNTGQTRGTKAEGKKKNMAKSEWGFNLSLNKYSIGG